MSTVHDRTGGHGCPYCSNNKASKETSLFKLAPSIAKEWDLTKNGKLTAKAVSLGSKKYVYWKCKNKHVWRSRIIDRAHGYHCPKCNDHSEHKMQITTSEYDLSLLSKFPRIATEWHPTKNTPVTPANIHSNSRRKFWWRCPRGHEWATAVVYRTSGSECPKCSRQTTKPKLRIYSELKTIFKNVRHRDKIERIECDILLADLKIAIQLDGWYYHKGKEVKDNKLTKLLMKLEYDVIRVRGNKLKPVGNTIFFSEETGLTIEDLQNIVKFILKIRPNENLEKIKKYLKKTEFTADNDYISLLAAIPLQMKGSSLFDNYPELQKWWHPSKNGQLTTGHVTSHSNLKVWWLCPKGHEFQGVIGDRSRGIGCPYCSGLYVTRNESFASKCKKLLKEWDYSKNKKDPYTVTIGSNIKVWWQCIINKRHKWQATIGNRCGNLSGCPYCLGKKVDKNNSLKGLFPKVAKQWHSKKNGKALTPTKVTAFSRKKVWWKCTKNTRHVWQAVIGNRTGNNSGCPLCYLDGKKKD